MDEFREPDGESENGSSERDASAGAAAGSPAPNGFERRTNEADPDLTLGDRRDGWRSGDPSTPPTADGRWHVGRRCSGPLGDLVAPLADALAVLGGAGGVDHPSLREVVTDLVRFRSLLHAATAEFVARWDARCLWADDGSRAARARLARDAGCNVRSTGRVVHVARTARSMPLATAAWRQGRISTDHVERLVRACTAERAQHFVKVEAHLVDVAANDEWVVFERAVALFETASDDAGSDPTDPEDLAKRANRERAHRNMRPVRIGDRWEIRGSLDKIGGQAFADMWERITDELWKADLAAARKACGPDASADEVNQAAMSMRTPAQRSADALVETAARAGTAPADGQRPRPLISVVVSATELCRPIREMFNGLVLSRLDVASLLSEADFDRIVYGPTGQPVEVASPQRFFTGAWRRAIEIRDRVCQHPTCDVGAEYCQVDHIVEHADGGETSIDNGRLLCPQHNRQRPGRRPPPASRRDSTDRSGGGGRGTASSSGGGSGGGSGGDDGDPDQQD